MARGSGDVRHGDRAGKPWGVSVGHANATGSLVAPPASVVARPELQFDDRGGYGACLFSLVNVLDTLPIPETGIA